MARFEIVEIFKWFGALAPAFQTTEGVAAPFPPPVSSTSVEFILSWQYITTKNQFQYQ